MNDNFQNTAADPTLRPIQNFRFMSNELLEAFNTQCDLGFPSRVLARIAQHFKNTERRDPSLCELRFLRALLNDRRRSPFSLYLDEYTPVAPEQARALADALRMHRVLNQATPNARLTLPRLLNTASGYLARSDIFSQKETLVWQKRALACQNAPVCGDMAVSPLAKPLSSSAQRRVLLCFAPVDSSRFDEELNDFLNATRKTCVHLHGVIGAEGILPHLFSLDGSVSLNLAALPMLSPAASLEALLTLRSPFALLLTDESSLPTVFAAGASLSVCGSLSQGNCVCFYRGAQRLACFDKSVLGCLNVLRKLTATEKQSQDPSPTVLSKAILEQPDTLRATLCVSEACQAPVLQLIGELAQKGADFTSLTCTLCLKIPTVDLPGTAITDALPLALQWHRIASELSLPSANNICTLGENSPRFYLYFETRRKTPPNDTFAQEWTNAANAGDFATLRAFLYEN